MQGFGTTVVVFFTGFFVRFCRDCCTFHTRHPMPWDSNGGLDMAIHSTLLKLSSRDWLLLGLKGLGLVCFGG